MEYQINREENWHTEIHVKIQDEKIHQEIDERYKEYQQNIKLEGFRKGKVPASLIKKMFGSRIEADVFQPYISDAIDKVFQENHFHMMSQPDIINRKYDRNEGLTFTIEFDVEPEFEVTGFENMPVEKISYTVGEKEVEAALENLRQRNAMIYPVEGGAEPGNILVADIQELDRTGVAIIGRRGENQTIVLNDDPEDELTRQLSGIRVGEQRRIVMHEQNGQADSGFSRTEVPREFLLQVSVKDIQKRVVPQLDDEFAKDIGKYESIEDLRQDLQDRLKREAEHRSQFLFERALEDELIKRVNIQAPPTMLQRYLDILVEDYKKEAKGKVDGKELREYLKTMAMRNLRWHLIREKMILQHGIEVADEEVDAKMKEMAIDMAQGEKKLQRIKDQVKTRLLDQKLNDFLVARANITELTKPWGQTEDDAGAIVQS